MPIGIAERGKILRHLELPITKLSVVNLLCNSIEQTSEQLAQQVNELIQQLDANSEEIRKASSGIVKVDVIEWKSERKCDLHSYRKYLIKQLSNAIGYTTVTIHPW